MRKSTTVTALLLAAALLGGARAASADLRQELGPDRAKLVEGVASQLYPGSHLEWTPLLTLVEGTTRRGLRIGGIDVRHDAGGASTGVVALEITEGRPAIFAALTAFQPGTARSPADIIEFKADAANTVTAIRRASLSDPSAAVELVEDVSLTALTYADPWPDVYVTYSGAYGTTDFHGQITWDEKLTFDPAITATGRAPSDLTRFDEDSPLERTDRVLPAVVDETTISFTSAASGYIVSRCTDPCLPDGRVLLALWWTASKVVASP